ITVPQLLWQVDFLSGGNAVGLTAYMFDPGIKLYMRALSLFHFWLPILLVWMVFRLGYDRRALVAWTPLSWALLLVCYLWMPPPSKDHAPNLPVNIDYVYGFSNKEPQTWMHPHLWVLV